MKEKLLLKIKEYIERTQRQIDGEWGSCRSIEELIKDGDMPEVYYDVIKELANL